MSVVFRPYLTFCFIALTLVSCKKEKSTRELLNGRWDVYFERYTTYQNNVITFDDPYNNPPGDFILEIFSDGTGKFYENNVVSSTFTWELLGSEKIKVTYSSQQPQEVEITVSESSLIWKMTIQTIILNIEYKIVDYKECNRIKT